jgi:hypothetical protein
MENPVYTTRGRICNENLQVAFYDYVAVLPLINTTTLWWLPVRMSYSRGILHQRSM